MESPRMISILRNKYITLVRLCYHSQSNDTWLLKLRGDDKTTEELLTEPVGCGPEEITVVMVESINNALVVLFKSEELPD
jgi:hypothetical protein